MKISMRMLLCAALAAAPAPAQAQLEDMSPRGQPVVGFEAAKSFFEGDGLEWYTSVLRARVLSPLGTTATLVADWGVSIAGLEGRGTDGTTTNPEIGLLFNDERGGSKGYASIFVPLSFGFGEDDASVGTGFFSNPLRPERFGPDLLSLAGGVTPTVETDGAAIVQFELGAAAWIPTGDAGGDTEVVARYGIGVSADTESVRVGGEIEGLAAITESGGLGERTLHQLLVSVAGVRGGPSFFVRVPLDDALDGIDATVGVSFAVGAGG